jgi:hypothetical protein
MPEPRAMLLKANLKHLRLPTMSAEFAKLAREASGASGQKAPVTPAAPRSGPNRSASRPRWP